MLEGQTVIPILGGPVPVLVPVQVPVQTENPTLWVRVQAGAQTGTLTLGGLVLAMAVASAVFRPPRPRVAPKMLAQHRLPARNRCYDFLGEVHWRWVALLPASGDISCSRVSSAARISGSSSGS